MLPVRLHKFSPGRIAITAILLFAASCHPGSSTDLLPEMNFLISLHPDVTDGLVGYWPLDGNTTNFGSSGSVADGTPVGTLSSCPDRHGNPGLAYCLDGSTSYIQIANNSQLEFDTNQDFTISAWAGMSPSAGSTGGIVSQNASSPILSYRLEAVPLANVFGERSDNLAIASYVYSSSFNPKDGVYRHYAFVKNGSHLSLYVNADRNATATDDSTTSTISGSVTYIGYNGIGGGNGFFNGSVDEVRIYNRALSDREIEILYNY